MVTRTVRARGFEPDKKGGHASSSVCHSRGGVGHSAFTPVETGPAVEPGKQRLSVQLLSDKQEAPLSPSDRREP
ncbi:MAG: hypothetical protein J07HR59_00603 [Halorubrum sp. J07HR59]|nr:MAG: hypothetical protein J07HR59_00603 [Halorubrum sp. J07HR59]